MRHPVYDIPRTAFLLEFAILKFFNRKAENLPFDMENQGEDFRTANY